MQHYMKAHTAPGFWHQYGSWIGSAAAASVITVMAFLYTSQLSRNESLTADVKTLKEQVELLQKTPAGAADTVYIVQESPAGYPAQSGTSSGTQENTTRQAGSHRLTSRETIAFAGEQHQHEGRGSTGSDRPQLRTDVPASPKNDIIRVSQEHDGDAIQASALSDNQLRTGSQDENVGLLAYREPTDIFRETSVARKMNYRLASRLTMRQVQRTLTGSPAQLSKAAMPVDQAAQTAKATNVIPKLNLKVPYRFGASFGAETNGNTKAVMGEVLVSRKFSLAAGISWLKVKPMEFFTEKIFRDKNRRDFKRSHPGEVPLALEVFNINVNPTLVQIPLTVAFRNDLKNDWVYYASAGTNINISSREKISFDCRMPNNQYYNQSFEKKAENPVVSSANLSLGIEKTFHPIVVQAEGYLYTYFKPLSPLSHSTGPGVKVKLMYQIGRKL
ncbi:hypothetical protein HWI92_23595 [Dyadobacter sandarakinus]|uniref:Outer membrane protein beta-barrel domain-containing protein n=2 Tax=Dyadobacter sandarakinus TaxID=2747268 RepID=A0ABX7IER6_9BACT|nr:hypothetical protein HWI92_23595 [Dyadobacter sandarakinus]